MPADPTTTINALWVCIVLNIIIAWRNWRRGEHKHVYILGFVTLMTLGLIYSLGGSNG